MIPRDKYRSRLLLFLGFLLICPKVRSSSLGPAVGEHFEDVAQKDSGENVKLDKQKGEVVKQQESVHSDKTNSQYSDAKDAGTYLKKESDTKAHDQSDSFEGQNIKEDKAEDSEQAGFKKGHKKGHHKQGFHNSYHKDESSNKSTFFDDFNDEADQAAFNNRHKSHDDKGGRRYQGSRRDGTENVRNVHNTGGYDRHGGSGNKYAGRNHFDRSKYLDDREAYNKHHKGHNAYDRGRHFEHNGHPPHFRGGFQGHGGGWNAGGGHDDWNGGGGHNDWNGGAVQEDWNAGGGHGGWNAGGGHGDWNGGGGHGDWNGGGGPGVWNERGGSGSDWNGPGYYGEDGARHEGGYGHGPDNGYGYGQRRSEESRALPIAADDVAPVVARRRQTITIYEDPRYEDPSTGQLRREGGEGEVKLDVRPSGQRYARYDDEYYVPRRDSSGAGVETSKINRLVYNYRRDQRRA